MNFVDAVKINFVKYADFQGTAARPEFWYFVLFDVLVSTAAGILDRPTHSNLFGSLVTLALFLPGIAVTTRRLHDIGRSGWWQLLGITGIGIIVLIYWYCQRGKTYDNRYALAATFH